MKDKPTSKKQEAHKRILESIHGSFRKYGYAGAGVDGLAKEAEVTSGALYSHFGSKAEAFREVVSEGVQQFDSAVKYYQNEYGKNWLEEFAKFYLGEKRECDLRDSCALQSLTSEISRHDKETRSVFQFELIKAAETVAKGMKGSDINNSTNEAWVTIAMLIGGVTLARAVEDSELANTIASSIQAEVTKANK